ncbi:MAG: efflux RND transporter periplasmic adaptor subunit [Bacteriodetes bacterium]|nr:efflux RND transporter periplasmic adaptor subunit [Bacteroidota bacterium]
MSDAQHADLSALKINRNAPVQAPSGGTAWGKIVTIVLVLALLGGGAWWFMGNSSFSAIEVDAVTATLSSPAQQNSVLTASGYVVAQRKAAVSSKVTGKLVALNVIEGDVVKQGQVIGKIESADVEATLQQLRAALEVAKADVENAKVEVDDAKLDMERKQQLRTQNAIAQVDVDNAKARYNKATTFLAARNASVKMAEANARNAEVQVENTVIRAPFDGTVLTKNANVGEVITALGAAAGSRGAAVTLADMNSLEVEADVSESNIERITQNQPCEITLNAYSDKRYRGFLSKIILTADRAKATVMVKIRFNERDERVLPEMGAKVLFLKPDSDQQTLNEAPKLLLPVSSVITKGGRKVVYKITDETVKEVSVQTGTVTDSYIEITQGVTAGERVVLKPTETLKDGAKITMKK